MNSSRKFSSFNDLSEHKGSGIERQVADFYRRMRQTATFHKYATVFLAADQIAREMETHFEPLERKPTSKRATLLLLPRAFRLVLWKLTAIVFRGRRVEGGDRINTHHPPGSAVIDVSPSTHFYDPVTPDQEDFPTRNSNCDDAVKERSIES